MCYLIHLNEQNVKISQSFNRIFRQIDSYRVDLLILLTQDIFRTNLVKSSSHEKFLMSSAMLAIFMKSKTITNVSFLRMATLYLKQVWEGNYLFYHLENKQL